jgi:creatinine amidohydrolase
MRRLFVELSAPAIAQLSPDGIALLPVGADPVLAESVARDAVATYGDAHDLWLLPAVARADPDALGRRLCRTPLHRLIVLSGEETGLHRLEACARDLRRSYGLSAFIVPVRPGTTDDVLDALLEVGTALRPLPS